MLIDGHVHLFHPKVISNVKKKKDMVELLKLKTEGVEDRTGVRSLEGELKAGGIGAGLVLPTALAPDVCKVNDSSYKMVETSDSLYTAGTLHPEYDKNREELVKFESRHIKGIKLCSFSQKFALDAPQTFDLFDLIATFNTTRDSGFFVILDTFFKADKFFGSDPRHTTAPHLLAGLITHFPGINFIAAHMGGLAAPFHKIRTDLTPMDNLFFDTSNAAHVLSEEEFVFLLKAHGPEHIIFGTDWPWFTHPPEIALQRRLFEKAGYSKPDNALVFSENMGRLMGIKAKW